MKLIMSGILTIVLGFSKCFFYNFYFNVTGVLSNLPTDEAVKEFVLKAAVDIARNMMFVPFAEGETGKKFADFARDITENLSPVSDSFLIFSSSLSSVVENIPELIISSRKVLKGSVMSVVRTSLHDALADECQREEWKEALVNVTGKPAVINIPELYLQEFIRQLMHKVVEFLVQCMRASHQDIHAVNVAKKTPEEFNTLFKQQTLHQVLGAALRSLLRRCRQYPNNARYQQFKQVTLEHLLVTDTTVASPQNSTYWSALLNRKSLLFLTEKAVLFL